MDVLLVSNGPGEVWGWAFPTAASLRRLGADVRVRLALPPCQYATGREEALARASGLFDEVMPPRACLLAAAGLAPVRADCVVHLGGDLWYAARFARRAGCPAVAYVERTLIARRHAGFAAVFTNTAQLATRLVAMGVPAGKVETAGELRADALALHGGGPTEDHAPRDDDGPRVVLLPGSRPQIFPAAAVVMSRLAEAIAALAPAARLAFAVSPFVADDVVARCLPEPIPVIRGDRERVAAYRAATLAVAMPGTAVVELAMLGTPTLSWLPLYQPRMIPFEGLKEWLCRVPIAGPAAKAAVVRRYFSKPRVLAIPNQETGRRLVEEYVGDDPVAAVAARVTRLLNDGPRLAEMRRDLAAYYRHAPGAADRIARRVAAIAS